MSECNLCPRHCGVDRTSGAKGFCGETAEIMCARAALHMWEEPCLSGEEGSGAVFFCGCNLRCVFCQNQSISRAERGVGLSVQQLADVFLSLENQKANNINLVTPTHYAQQIAAALDIARERGLSVPVVYNTSGYETVENIRILEPYVDIWLPDMKYRSSELSARYSKAPDYFDAASAALAEMVAANERRTEGSGAVFDERGMMRAGVIVRHLCLPGQAADSKHVIRYLHETYGDRIYISIMNQYTPFGDLSEFPELTRKLGADEYDRIVRFAERIGVTKGFIQEGGTAEESFIPDFDGTGLPDP